MIFAIQNICAKNSLTKSKDKASIGKNNKPSVMGTLHLASVGKKAQIIITIFFAKYKNT